MPPWRDDTILESLDSLWFFSSVLSPSSSIPFHRTHICDTLHPKTKQPIPSSQAPHTEHMKPPTPLVHAVVTAIGSEQEIKVVSRDPKESTKEQRGKTSSSKQGTRRTSELKSKYTEEVWGLGLRFCYLRSDFTAVYMFSGHQGRTRACDRYHQRNPVLYGNMPPFHDGLAMKEHLKSWAHAVACTVR